MEQVSKDMMIQLNAVIKAELNPTQLEDVIDNEFFTLGTGAIKKWYYHDSCDSAADDQLKLIKHIWLNDPQFEEEKPKKYIVRSKKTDVGGDYWYVVNTGRTFYTFHYAHSPMAKIVVKFDTREEAEKWTNPQTEVVEVEE